MMSPEPLGSLSCFSYEDLLGNCQEYLLFEFYFETFVSPFIGVVFLGVVAAAV